VSGQELWKTDGTTGGTEMVLDIWPGVEGSAITFPKNLNGTLIFTAGTPTYGRELWKSDGTPEGTVMVKDLVPWRGSSRPMATFAVGSNVFFLASTPETGEELFKSNGIGDGTVLVKDIVPGVDSGSPKEFNRLGSLAFFGASTSDTGQEPWRSDGTEEGTFMLKDIYAGSTWSRPRTLGRVGRPESQLLFVAGDLLTGRELWATDGSKSGTGLVKDIRPGTAGSNIIDLASDIPNYGVSINGSFIFSATDGSAGQEPYISDGTTAGTFLLADIAAGSTPSNPADFVVIEDSVYFLAQDAKGEVQVWKSDGTCEGTLMAGAVADVANPSRLFAAALKGQYLFSVNGVELWQIGGVNVEPEFTATPEPSPTAAITSAATPTATATSAPTPGKRDLCPDDPAKLTPGVCGCGKPDVDSNNNGVQDCLAARDLLAELKQARQLLKQVKLTGTRSAMIATRDASKKLAKISREISTSPGTGIVSGRKRANLRKLASAAVSSIKKVRRRNSSTFKRDKRRASAAIVRLMNFLSDLP